MSQLLIVDDDPGFRTLVKQTLGARGHTVIEAGTGRAGADALATRRPDLVIVDGLLPDGDGVRWIEARRRAGDTTPMMFVSAFWKDLQSFQRLTRELGVRAVVHKPVTPGQLVQQIEALLGTMPGATCAATSAPAPPEPADDASLTAALAEATAEYAAGLPGKVAEIRKLVARVQAAPEDRAALASCRDAAHRLAGTAGSYGFDEVGGAAAAIEALAVRAGEGARVGGLEWLRASDMLARRQAEAGERRAPAAPGVRAPERFVALHRVLVVDDDPEFLAAIAALGRRRGVAIEGVRTAAEALAAAGAAAPDAVLTDVHLPGSHLSSFELARALRALPGCDGLPLAFVSGKGALADRIAATHVGAMLYLSKPIDADSLSTAVHLLTAARRAVRPRVLVVDDDPAALEALRAILEDGGMDVEVLTDATRVLDVLDELHPDAILLDGAMPGASGLDVCRTIRSMPRWQHLVVLFVTAEGAVGPRIAALEAGADDYLHKPVIAEELLARVKMRVERSRLMRDRLERDGLTGLPLRRVFLEQLAARLGEARRRQRAVTLALVDVDHFKQVNDRHGHMVGDQVLAALGQLFAQRFRAEDLRGRFGGEEMALAFCEEDAETVAGILQRVLAEFAAMRFHGKHGEAFSCTFSVGIAAWPDDAADLEGLVAAADLRLYAAKAAGRNRAVWRDEGGQR